MDFTKMDKTSTKKFGKNYGDKMTLNEFISSCACGGFIDYDGFAREIIWNGNVIYDNYFYPSDVLENKQKFLALQEELGELEIVWYNK